MIQNKKSVWWQPPSKARGEWRRRR